MYMTHMGLEKQHENKYQLKALFLIQINMDKLFVLIQPFCFYVREKGGFNLEFQLFSCWYIFMSIPLKTELKDRLIGCKLHLFQCR